MNSDDLGVDMFIVFLYRFFQVITIKGRKTTYNCQKTVVLFKNSFPKHGFEFEYQPSTSRDLTCKLIIDYRRHS